MRRFTQISIFIILLGTLVVTACTLPCDLSSKGTETLPVNDRKKLGTVTGKVYYPSESIPPMTLYFQSTLNDTVEALMINADQGTFSIDLEPGVYLAYAYPMDEANYVIGGMYSALVPCGLAVHCKDHSLLPIKVESGETTSGIDICDWYGGPAMVPLPPGIKAPEVPDIVIYSDLGLAGKDVGLTAYLELPEHLLIGEEVNLKFTFPNVSDTPLYILKWFTPLEGIGGEIFRVTHEGQAIPYEGILASRSSPTPDEYVFLGYR